jgi:hypothetical protein
MVDGRFWLNQVYRGPRTSPGPRGHLSSFDRPSKAGNRSRPRRHTRFAELRQEAVAIADIVHRPIRCDRDDFVPFDVDARPTIEVDQEIVSSTYQHGRPIPTWTDRHGVGSSGAMTDVDGLDTIIVVGVLVAPAVQAAPSVPVVSATPELEMADACQVAMCPRCGAVGAFLWRARDA